MTLSARNRLTGTVQSVETNDPIAEVVLELDDGQTVAAIITSNSVDRLGLAEGDDVDAVIKATEVLIDA
ncbi:molybdopterin-binding protein [Natribaculum luteum]|uniref:Molybdopterin-binding protein n=1 Tax=Natribaculum luteum TaxID=1586232 RepID=A0ABD5P518_9EURY|nr:TOBE domain-containing protein [Natribaculum luteum]